MGYSLVQVAQESAQYAKSAAGLVARTDDFDQAKSVAEAAEQAAGRARWASTAAMEYESPLGEGDSMVASIRQMTQQAFEQALASAQKAVQLVNAIDPSHREKRTTDTKDKGGPKRLRHGCQNFRDGRCQRESDCPYSHESKEQGKLEPRKKTRVACMFFKNGTCLRGANCLLSHDPADDEPLATWDKRPFKCSYFEEGKCIRGQACAFAHGAEELEMVKKMKSAMRRSMVRGVEGPLDTFEVGGVCWDHRDKGFCRYGVDCRFRHDDDTGVAVPFNPRDPKNQP